MGSNTGKGKVAYSWISPDPAKARLTLGVVVIVVVDYTIKEWRRSITYLKRDW